jgi:hypothetical protein
VGWRGARAAQRSPFFAWLTISRQARQHRAARLSRSVRMPTETRQIAVLTKTSLSRIGRERALRRRSACPGQAVAFGPPARLPACPARHGPVIISTTSAQAPVAAPGHSTAGSLVSSANHFATSAPAPGRALVAFCSYSDRNASNSGVNQNELVANWSRAGRAPPWGTHCRAGGGPAAAAAPAAGPGEPKPEPAPPVPAYLMPLG